MDDKTGLGRARAFGGISVRTSLTFWNVGVLALALVVSGAALRGIVQASLLAALDRNLLHQAQAHQSVTAHWFGTHADGPGPPPEEQGPGPPPPGGPPHGGGPPPEFTPAGVLPTRLLNLRELRLQPWSVSLPWDPDTFPRSARGRDVFSTVSARQGRLRVLSVPLRRQGRIIGVAQVAASLAGADRETAHLTRALLTLIPLVLLVAGVEGALLTGRTLRPVRAVTEAANRIGAEDLSARLAVVGRDEFSALATTFNGMLERLDGAFQRITTAYERERRFTADASHELRTPLAIIKGYTSLALSEEHTAAEYRQALEATDQAVDRTNRLVQDLLLLARADAGQYGPTLVPVSVGPTLDQALAAVCATAKTQMALRMDADCCVRGNADALGRLFVNLLSNAARHTPASGRVTVGAEAQGAWVSVTVTDTGEGIAPEHLPHLGERFYRVDSARARTDGGGTGLGLAICHSIAEAHGGRITTTSARGVGTAVRVLLPRAADAAPTSQGERGQHGGDHGAM